MKNISVFFAVLFIAVLLCSCSTAPSAQIAATTLPVYEFTALLCQNTGISVCRLVTENVSCLHDYTLQANQMRAIENANIVIISGADFEVFLHDVLSEKETVIDSSKDIPLLCGGHTHDNAEHDHHQENDPHIWLSISNARIMARNIYAGLVQQYPQHKNTFDDNLDALEQKFDTLEQYGQQQLASLQCNELITFHDGFAYLAESYNLHILRAVEEESGSEASARELKEIITLVEKNGLPAIFTETNGSAAAAEIICAETGIRYFPLDMAISGNSYFDAMYHNIDTLKEALG